MSQEEEVAVLGTRAHRHLDQTVFKSRDSMPEAIPFEIARSMVVMVYLQVASRQVDTLEHHRILLRLEQITFRLKVDT